MENKASTSRIDTQADAVIYFIQRLDVEMVKDILDERTYQGFEKSIFINKLGIAIDEFIESGDTFLDSYNGYCNSKDCNFKCSGLKFIGNKSGKYMSLIIEIKEDKVVDIYECGNLKMEINTPKIGVRVKVNKYEFRKDFPEDIENYLD